MNLLYTSDDILSHFDVGALKRGTDYYAQNKVRKITPNPDGSRIVGVVGGSSGREYEVSISINTDKHPIFYASCSCPVRRNCKHAVAVLCTHLFQQMDSIGGGFGESYIETDVLTETLSFGDGESSEGDTRGAEPRKTEVELWLDNIEEQLSPSNKISKTQLKPKSKAISPNRLLYVLSLKKQPKAAVLSVEYISARKLKAGGYGQESYYDPYRIMNNERASFIGDDDESVLRDIYARKVMDNIEYFNLSEAGGGGRYYKRC